jgi:transcriptional regulator with XRE-family HTH domain
MYSKKIMKHDELSSFITLKCKERRLSFRSLSLNAGLSQSTVHNIVSGKAMPNVTSLNAIADYIGVTRVFLWKLAGLLEDDDPQGGSDLHDPQVKYYFAKVDKLPDESKQLVLKVLDTLIENLNHPDNI